LASVTVWLAVFPLYAMGDPAVSHDDRASIAHDLSRLGPVVFTSVVLGLVLYITLMVLADGPVPSTSGWAP
jgi:hypothetical protein